ncbi:MAG: SigE family RNA polymerase sigma factor [Geodermatophilaceae bacterium]
MAPILLGHSVGPWNLVVVLAGVSGVDVDGLAAFYAASCARIVAVVTLVGGDRAEAQDVVQEAFVRLIPRWTLIATYDDPEAWVRRVAFRLLSNRFRQRRRLVPLSAAVDREMPPVGDPGVDLVRALARLPLPQRQVVVLHYLYDLRIETVANELGVPVGTVKSRLSRSRAVLAPLLREDVPDHA